MTSWLWQARVGGFLIWCAREPGAGALCLFLRCPPMGELLKQTVLSCQRLETHTYHAAAS